LTYERDRDREFLGWKWDFFEEGKERRIFKYEIGTIPPEWNDLLIPEFFFCGGEETDFGLVAAELQFPFFPMKKLPSKELDDGFCELGFSQSLKKFGIWNFWC
jgi:hypothetical protein